MDDQRVAKQCSGLSKRAYWIFLVVTCIFFGAFCWLLLYGSNKTSSEEWAHTRERNAHLWYWTGRTNLESSRKSMTPEGYDDLRKKIDEDWKRDNPGLTLPDFELGSQRPDS